MTSGAAGRLGWKLDGLEGEGETMGKLIYSAIAPADGADLAGQA